MLNQVANDALFSAKYVENYIDYIENLPDDAQRLLSRIRDIDVQYRNHLRDVDHYYDQWESIQSSTNEAEIQKRTKLMAKIQKSFINAQELGDEKMATVNQLQELIEQKTKQIDIDFHNLDFGRDDVQMDDVSSSGGGNNPNPGVNQISSNNNNNNVQQSHGISLQKLSVSGPMTNQSVNSNKQEVQANYGNNIGTTQQIFSSNTSSIQRGGTPTSNERTSILTNSSQPLPIDQQQRTVTKRSRRPRNETNIDLGGNESNSANESNSQKQSLQSSSSGASQQNNKKSIGAQNVAQNANAGSKKKKRKARGQAGQQRDQRDETPPPDPIDPDEPTYCLCDQISFGEMILCDNDLCPIEWFHFSCVTLTTKPKGKWFCPNCRGDRPNCMKPKAQFLKELERYNKEKEEKT